MASRSRKRRRQRAARSGTQDGRSAAPAPGSGDRPRSRRSPADEDRRPEAPWGSFPLVEIVVAVAIVMLVAGLIVGGARGTTLLGTGLALGSLAGLELAIREHFAGYRSHTLLLAAAVGVATMLGLFYLADLTPTASLVAAAAAFAVAAVALGRAFRARSGRLFKLK